MKTLNNFLKEVRQGRLAEESRKRINEKMKPDEKVKVLYELAKENDYDFTCHELQEEMKMSDAKVYEHEILVAAEAGIAVEHEIHDYGWPFSENL